MKKWPEKLENKRDIKRESIINTEITKRRWRKIMLTTLLQLIDLNMKYGQPKNLKPKFEKHKSVYLKKNRIRCHLTKNFQ
jgi:hypothetical protein